MREGRASTTAMAVAAARAVASLPGRARGPAVDEAAATLLPAPIGHALRALAPLSARTSAVPLALRLGSLGFVDHLGLRTAALDDAIIGAMRSDGSPTPAPFAGVGMPSRSGATHVNVEALARGPRQLVVLGAGLDSRAYRLPGLEDVVVFEVDHPATQRHKRDRAARLTPRAKEVRFVAIDFEREPLADRLASEGHDPSAPTVWLWEGVVPYLEPAVTRATLRSMDAMSAPGSRLALTYGTERRIVVPRPIHLAFRLLGEPLRGLMSSEALHALLAQTGWQVTEDSGPHDWRARYGWGIDALLVVEERLVLCER